jgi:MFS family permease
MSSTTASAAPAPSLPRGFPGYVQLLKQNLNIRNIWLAQVISQMGQWFNSVALLGLINTVTTNALAPALITMFQMLPGAIGSLTYSGYIVDRFDRKKLLVGIDLARAFIALTPLLITSADTVWIAFVVITALSIGDSIAFPAVSASQPNFCNPSELSAANALQQSTWAGVSMLGAFVGGLIAEYYGRNTAFMLNALSFLGSAYFLMRVRGRFNQSDKPLSARFSWHALTEGFRFMQANPHVLAMSLVKPIWAFSFAAVGLFSVYAYRVYGTGDQGTSWLYAARGIGSFVGPVLLQSLVSPQTPRQYALILLGSLAVCVLGYGIWGFSLSPLIGALGIFIGHLGGGNAWTYSRIFVQRAAPDHIRGRVMALDAVGFTLVSGVFAFVIGAIANDSTPMFGVLSGVGATLLCSAIWFVYVLKKVMRAEG